MKDKFKEEIISEFVGVKSKIYSFVSENGKENKKAKTVKKNIKNTRHKEFVVLFNKKITRHNMKRIKSKLHRIGTYVCKISLSSFDDKRHKSEDDINSLAYFHKDIRRQ